MSHVESGANFWTNHEANIQLSERISGLIRRGGGYSADPLEPRVGYKIDGNLHVWLQDLLGEPLDQHTDLEEIAIPSSIASKGGFYGVIFDKELEVDTPYGKLPRYVLDEEGKLWFFSTYYLLHPNGLAVRVQLVFDEEKGSNPWEIKNQQAGNIKKVQLAITSAVSRITPLEAADYGKIGEVITKIEQGQGVEQIFPQLPIPH